MKPLEFPRGDNSLPETRPTLKWQVRQAKKCGPCFVDARLFLVDRETKQPYASGKGFTLSHHEIDDVIEFLQRAKELTR